MPQPTTLSGIAEGDPASVTRRMNASSSEVLAVASTELMTPAKITPKPTSAIAPEDSYRLRETGVPRHTQQASPRSGVDLERVEPEGAAEVALRPSARHDPQMDEHRPSDAPPVEQRPPARFYVIALAALALLLLGITLTAQEANHVLAGISTGLGALGMFVCAWMLRRGRVG